MSRAVVVMGKLPRPGRVKTRLTTSLSPAQAADLYRAFLVDTFRLVQRATPTAAWVFACALAEQDRLPEAEALVPDGWRVVPQAGDGLGARIDHARETGAADHVLVMGSDSPTLPEARLVEAFEVLAEGGEGGPAPVVVAPTEDGGYALIGFAAPTPAVLTDIPWSTSEVMAATRAAAARADVPIVELAPTYDVDHPQDLARLAADAHPDLHPATVAALASLGAFGL